MEEVVIVNEVEVGTEDSTEFSVGELFHSYKEFETKLKCYSSRTFTEFWRRDTRTIATARKRLNRTLNDNLQYYELTLCCIHGGKSFKPRGKGIRNTRLVVS